MRTTETMEINFNSYLCSTCKSILNATVITGIYPPHLEMELLNHVYSYRGNQLHLDIKRLLVLMFTFCAYMPGGAKQAQTFTVCSQRSGACAILAHLLSGYKSQKHTFYYVFKHDVMNMSQLVAIYHCGRCSVLSTHESSFHMCHLLHLLLP